MTSVQKHLARRLKDIRATRELTQERLAKRAHISRAYLARMEIGRHDPPLSTLVRLAKALNVKVTELLEETQRAQKGVWQ